jgi:hypothetical protein
MPKLICRVQDEKFGTCRNPSTLVVITTEPNYEDEVLPGWITSTPICSDHAPEEVHELKQCSAPGEFLIIEVTDEGFIKVLEGGVHNA